MGAVWCARPVWRRAVNCDCISAAAGLRVCRAAVCCAVVVGGGLGFACLGVQESWGADLRNVTVLFVNLGLKDHDLLAAAAYDDAMKRAHDVLLAVQVRGPRARSRMHAFAPAPGLPLPPPPPCRP